MGEDEGAKTSAGHAETPEPAPPAAPPSSPHPQTESPHPQTESPRPQTEWTASDARGPLIAAEDGPGTESNFGSSEPVEPQPSSSPPPEPRASAPETTAEMSTGPAADHPPPPPPPPPPPQKGSSWPIAAGIVGGAVIGAAVALYVDHGQGGASGDAAAVAALSAKVQALEARPDTSSGLKSTVADLQSRVDGVEKSVAALPKPAPGKAAAASDLAPLEQRVAALAGGVDALQKQSAGAQAIDAKVGGLETAVAGLQKQTAAAGSSLQAMQDQQNKLAGKVGAPALAVVADSLVQAIDQGLPYATQADALASLGADPTKVAVLKPNAASGIASAKTLAAKFAPLAEPILATEHKAPPNASFVDRLKSGMFSLVSVHRSDDLGGSDLASRVARIQADLAHDDLADALATWSALPADAKAKSDAWGALLKASADTMAAARALQTQAIAALGGKAP